jgi:hypothetical protein
MRSCNNCVWRDKCKEAGAICKNHNTLEERINSVFATGGNPAFIKFAKEWDEARFKLRKIGGLA